MCDILKCLLEQLHGILQNSNASRCLQATSISQDIFNYSLGISDDERAFCSSLVFHNDVGLLKFIKATVGLKEFESVKADILRFLVQYCDGDIDKGIAQYLKQLKELCITSYFCDNSVKVKTEGINLLNQLLSWDEKLIRKEIDVASLIKRLWSEFMKGSKAGSATLRGTLYALMGVFCEKFPDMMMDNEKRLLHSYLSFLKEEIESNKKTEMLVITGCLKGLTGYLYNFTQSVSEGSKFAAEIYKYVKKCILSQEYSRYDTPKAALSLLKLHCAQFKELITDDGETLYKALEYWSGHQNRDVKHLASATTDQVLLQISACISQNGDTGNVAHRKLLKKFMIKFHSLLNSSTSTSKELSTAIRGYGKLAEACSIFLKDEEMKMIFEEMLKRSEQCYMNIENISEENLYQLPLFLEALACIIKQLKQILPSYLYPIEHIIITLFDYFPKLSKNSQQLYMDSFHMLIEAMSSSPALLKTCLSDIIYQCVIRTCSYPLEVDEIIAESDEKTIKVSFKTFIPVWTSLLEEKNYKIDKFDETGKAKSLKELVYDNLMEAILLVLDRLNFNLEKPTESEVEAESDVTSDPVVGLVPKMPKDFVVFINLVDFCKQILCHHSVQSFERWLYLYLKRMITLSVRYPIVSGFYKLLQIACTLIEQLKFFQDLNTEDMKRNDEKYNTYAILHNYINEVVARFKQYKDDLQMSCMQLVLSLPVEVIKDCLHQIIPVFQAAFEFGTSHYELADFALETLEKCKDNLKDDDMTVLLPKILPCLDNYLQSPIIEQQDDLVTSKVKLTSTERKIKRIPIRYLKALIKANKQTIESPLLKLKLRIIKFLGLLGGRYNVSLLDDMENAALSEAMAWDTEEHLSFALPFQDMKPVVFLDSYYPRVVSLALSSSNRQTKVAACELLHALVLFTLGKSVQLAAKSKQASLEVLYRRIFPALLKLSCSTEQVAEQLFSPLVFQIIHWFTGNTKFESPETMALLDSMLDGITNSTDSSLRDFCGKCIKEFLHWSIKHSTTEQLDKNPANPKSLLKRIYSLALHPNPFKRLGAAVTFNNIYAVFREQETLVDVFTLEIFINFMKSLGVSHRDEMSYGTTDQCEHVIQHLKKIICKKSKLLLKANKKRQVPRDFKEQSDKNDETEFTLGNVVIWIIRHIGSPKTAMRKQCMELLYEFLPLQHRAVSVKTWMSNTLESEHAKFFTRKFEKGGQTTKEGIIFYPTLPDLFQTRSSVDDLILWFEWLLAALDCYCWVFRSKSLTPSQLFIDNDQTRLLQTLQYFFQNLAFLDANQISQKFLDGAALTPTESESCNRLRCSIFSHIFNFLTCTLSDDFWTNENMETIMKNIFTKKCFLLYARCVFMPDNMGFSVSNITQVNKLQAELRCFSNAVSICSTPFIREQFISTMSKLLLEKEFDLNTYLPIDLCETGGQKNKSCVSLIQLVSGYVFLMEVGLLRQISSEQMLNNINSQLLTSLVNSIIPLSGGRPSTVYPLQQVLAERFLDLAFQLESESRALINILFDKRTIKAEGFGRHEERGSVLYNIFSGKFLHHFIKDPSIIDKLFEHGRERQTLVLNIITGILLECRKKTDKLTDYNVVCHQVLCNWTKLLSIAKQDNQCKASLLQIAKLLLTLSPNGVDVEDFSNLFHDILMEKTNQMTLKENVIDLLPTFFKYCNDEQGKTLQKGITNVVVNHFPTSSADLEIGSSRYIEYISTLGKLLKAMLHSDNLLIFQSLINVFVKETNEVYEEKLQPALVAFVKKLQKASEKFFEYCLKLFVDESRHPNVFREGIIERVCLPSLHCLSLDNLRDFFIQHIPTLTSLVTSKFTKTNEEMFENQLITKKCCYQILSIMYQSFSKEELSTVTSKLVLAYNSKPVTGKELYTDLCRAAHSAYTEDIRGDTVLFEKRRQYHCAAYNCLMAIISCIQTELKFYTGLLFSENVSKGSFIFENLIDLKKTYCFGVELSSVMLKKNALELIRRNAKEDQLQKNVPSSNKGVVSYMSSQYLLDSSLSQDVSQFDFNNPKDAYTNYQPIRKIHQDESLHSPTEEMELLEQEEPLIEFDDLNQHEIMMPLLSLIKHMKVRNIYTEPKEDVLTTKDLPSWMKFLHSKMAGRDTATNIKLFIAKMVVNQPKIFEKYGSLWFSPLTDFILNNKIEGSPLNYFVTDIIVVMLSWSTTTIPEDSVSGRNLASSLLDYLMRYCHQTNKAILKHNMQVVKTLLNVWKDRLEVNYKLICEHLNCKDENTKDNLTGLQLLGLVLSSGFPLYSRQLDLTEDEFLTVVTRNLSFKYKEVFASAAEVCGLGFNHCKENGLSSTELHSLVQQYMSQFSKTSKERFVICLYRMHLYYSEIIDSYIPQLLYCLTSLYGILKTRCIQCLASRIEDIPAEHQNVYTQIKGQELENMLSHKDEETQIAAIKLVHGLLKTLPAAQIVIILPKIAELRTCESNELRGKVYDLAMWVYDTYRGADSMETDLTGEILQISKDILLVGINDSNSDLSSKILNFWQDGSRLPNTTIERLTEIMRALYSNKTENEYLSYATNLLLHLTSVSPDYIRPLFDSGLDTEENFRNFHVNFSWQRQNVSMKPLFAATQNIYSSSYSMTQGGSNDIGMLRKTQTALEFTQTVAASSSSNWMNPSMQISSQSFEPGLSSSSTSATLFGFNETLKSATTSKDEIDGFKKPTKETTNQILRLKKKYFQSKKTHQYAMVEEKRQKVREKTRERQRLARDRKVVMYRKYRIGELPDIQIKHSELIVPLQALAQLDGSIACRLFCTLFSAVINELPDKLSEDNVTKVCEDIQIALDSMMKLSTKSNPSFTYALENVCYKNQRFKLDPQIVSNASIISAQQPVGILLLEKQLLSNFETQEPKRKRARGIVQKPEDIRTWLELTKIYSAINDYDMLRSIFSSCISKADITKKALSSEATNDYESALALYKEASRQETWENSPTEEEEEYWDTARLRCYKNLSRWPNLLNFTLQSLKGEDGDEGEMFDMMKVWEDDMLQDTYLPCYIKSNIKLLCQGELKHVHKGFETFIKESWKSIESKEHLQSRYSDELALLRIFNDEYGEAKHFLNISNQTFMDEWSHTSKLITSNRHQKLQRLQNIVEMDEFITLMSTEDRKNKGKVSDLLTKWSSRLPHEKIHSTMIWDDIIMNRCAFIRKMKGHFKDDSLFLKKLNHAEIYNILQIAEVARKQGNYAVAKQYLRDSSELTRSDDTDLLVPWRTTFIKIHCDQVKMFNRKTNDNLTGLASALKQLNEEKKHENNKTEVKIQLKLLEHGIWKCMANCVRASKADESKQMTEYFRSIPEIEYRTTEQCIENLHELGMAALNSSLAYSNKLEQNSNHQEIQVKVLVKLALACDDRIKEGGIESGKKAQYADLIIRNLLKAMKLGSVKARIRFPRLLQLIEEYPDTRQVFQTQTTDIPCWMFLGWINQIVALIDKPLQSSLTSILDNISKMYPQALMYPLHVSQDQYQFSSDQDGSSREEYFHRLYKAVVLPLVKDLTNGLSQLTNPNHILKDILAELKKFVQSKDKENIKKWCRELSERLLNVSMAGSIVKNFAKAHKVSIENVLGKDCKKLIGMSAAEFKQVEKKLQSICGSKTKYKESLNDFSPWLGGFHIDKFANHLEIPGQYNGDRKPMLEYHVKIVSFDERINILESIRQPKRVSIRGDDEKEYKFLVKGGEDLRQDQRIEQIFVLMNSILQNDSVCSNRMLKLKTYGVIPMTTRVGLIEWVDHTETYRGVLMKCMGDQKDNRSFQKHVEFLKRFGRSYNEMYKEADYSAVVKAHAEKVNAVPWDLLRRAFTKFSSSSEAYFVLRSHFIQSHSCMSIAHYILGIGDRHLSNILIDKRTGGVVGIDFGQAFGVSTTMLPVPDLTPFRLTSQMLNFLRPLNDPAPYKQSMMAVLQAFRRHSSALINTMDVFIKEPLLDWQNTGKILQYKMKVSQDDDWYPNEKIKICRQKLAGINPAFIITQEIESGHSSNQVYKDFIKVAQGDERYNVRKVYLDKTDEPETYNLTVEEQVDCLVDQATDPNILGRAWVGWKSWL